MFGVPWHPPRYTLEPRLSALCSRRQLSASNRNPSASKPGPVLGAYDSLNRTTGGFFGGGKATARQLVGLTWDADRDRAMLRSVRALRSFGVGLKRLASPQGERALSQDHKGWNARPLSSSHSLAQPPCATLALASIQPYPHHLLGLRTWEKRPRSTGLLRFHGGTNDGAGENRHGELVSCRAFIIKPNGRRLRPAPLFVAHSPGRLPLVNSTPSPPSRQRGGFFLLCSSSEALQQIPHRWVIPPTTPWRCDLPLVQFTGDLWPGLLVRSAFIDALGCADATQTFLQHRSSARSRAAGSGVVCNKIEEKGSSRQLKPRSRKFLDRGWHLEKDGCRQI